MKVYQYGRMIRRNKVRHIRVYCNRGLSGNQFGD